jgi:ribosomal protein L4
VKTIVDPPQPFRLIVSARKVHEVVLIGSRQIGFQWMDLLRIDSLLISHQALQSLENANPAV